MRRVLRYQWLMPALCYMSLPIIGLPQGGSTTTPSADTAVVRYQVTDVTKSIAFYTKQLGFNLDQRTGPFASVSRGKLTLILSGPGASGSRPMPDGRRQTPGGWNRIVIYVDDLPGHIERFKKANIRFRNRVEAGPGGTQILIEDPDGNPIELHEAPKGGAK